MWEGKISIFDKGPFRASSRRSEMKAFLTGLGIGVGLGVLFAPDSGAATRKKVGERFRHWSESLSRQAENLKTATRGVADHGSETAARATGTTSDLPPKKSADRESARSERDELINTVGREELMNINGIGPVLADRIISGRPYSSRRELVERGILPQSTFDELERELGPREKDSA
jgi:DNA uptake protein ComE-like DNA-binding protein